jgi:hypothetical protein
MYTSLNHKSDIGTSAIKKLAFGAIQPKLGLYPE